MRFLNLGAGATRPQSDEWTNLDNLFDVLKPGTPERENLMREKNYVEHRLGETLPMPFRPGTFDGILCSHVLEHFDAILGVYVMRQCLEVLKPGGILLVSVPDASYFREHFNEDTPENAQHIFGEPIHLPDGEQTFFGYALWNRYHKAILTADALWCYFKRAGFDIPAHVDAAILGPMTALLNRRKFSVVMIGKKP